MRFELLFDLAQNFSPSARIGIEPFYVIALVTLVGPVQPAAGARNVVGSRCDSIASG
jgi:hypothetical protein